MSTFIDLLRAHKAELERHHGHRITDDMRIAMHAMLRCQTEKLGQSQWYCAHCHFDDRRPLSCGHRHCPQCLHRTTSDWLKRQKQKLLPVHYFMVTFTLPYQLRPLARKAPKALYSAMFQVAAGVLKSFAHRQSKGALGFTAVLHTHSRQRNLHPHLHIVVAGGRYHASKQSWYKENKQYLFNAFAMAKVWRARLLDALTAHPELWVPKQTPIKWVVDCRSVGKGQPALEYLSRYLYRGVLPDRDIVSVENDTVTFRYRESKTKQWTTRTLPTLKFLLLVLQHTLPKGLQRVRDYGFLRGQARHILSRIQWLLVGDSLQKVLFTLAKKSKAVRACPCCQHEMGCVGITRPR